MQGAIPDMLRTPTQIIENTYNLYCNPQGKRRLPNDFIPGPYDVICARGKKAHDHEGNVRFRAMVETHQAEYANCTCKHEKSKIVSYIVNSIRNAASYHQGGFVKNVDGLWFEVGDRAAKEKIGQTFRDLLHTKYSSSTKAKAKARIQKRVDEYNEKTQDDFSANRGSPSPPPFDQQQTQMAGNGGNNSSNNSNNSRTGRGWSGLRSSLTKSIPIPSSLNIPLSVPSLKKFGSLRNSEKKEMGFSFLNSFNPDKPFSDKAVLEQLRSSVQTVEYNPNDEMMMSTNTFTLPTDEDWMRLSATNGPVNQSFSVPTNITTSNGGGAGAGGGGGFNARMSSTNIAPEDIDQIVEAFMFDSTTTAGGGGPGGAGAGAGGDANQRHGIFSSSTRSNPFASSITVGDLAGGPGGGRKRPARPSLIASSVTSANNPLLMASTRSSFMDMDLDGLMDGMDSMSMMMKVSEDDDL